MKKFWKFVIFIVLPIAVFIYFVGSEKIYIDFGAKSTEVTELEYKDNILSWQPTIAEDVTYFIRFDETELKTKKCFYDMTGVKPGVYDFSVVAKEKFKKESEESLIFFCEVVSPKTMELIRCQNKLSGHFMVAPIVEFINVNEDTVDFICSNDSNDFRIISFPKRIEYNGLNADEFIVIGESVESPFKRSSFFYNTKRSSNFKEDAPVIGNMERMIEEGYQIEILYEAVSIYSDPYNDDMKDYISYFNVSRYTKHDEEKYFLQNCIAKYEDHSPSYYRYIGDLDFLQIAFNELINVVNYNECNGHIVEDEGLCYSIYEDYAVLINSREKIYEMNIADSIYFNGIYYPVKVMSRSLMKNDYDSHLQTITIGKNINIIRCFVSSVKNIIYRGDIRSWCKIKSGSLLFNEGAISDLEYSGKFYLQDEFGKTTLLKELVIPEEVVYLKSGVFSNISSIESIYIGPDVQFIAPNAFAFCASINEINVAEENKFFDSRNNCNAIIDSKNNILVRGSNGTKDLIDVVEIGDYAFSGCDNLSEIDILSCIKRIGHDAFNACKSIEKIVIPEGVEKLYGDTFANCTSLLEIVIPKNLSSCEYREFYKCESLNKVYYNGTIEDWCNISFVDVDYVLGGFYEGSYPMDYAKHFYMLNENKDYVEIKEIVIPGSVKSIKTGQFYGFDNLERVIIEDGVESIDNVAFYNCNIKEIILPNSIVTVHNNFISSSSIESITTPFVDFIKREEYYDWYRLEEIRLNGEEIELNNLMDAINVKKIIISKDVKKLSGYYKSIFNTVEKVFYEGNIDDWCGLEIESGISLMSENVSFYTLDDNNEWHRITEIHLPEGLKEISDYFFSYFTQLDKVYIPKSVEYIGNCVFEGCNNLTIYFEGNKLPDRVANNWNISGCPIVFLGEK